MSRRLPVVLSLQEFNQLLKKTRKRTHRLAFKLGFFCGLRVSEVVKLIPSDVDYGRQMLFVRQAKGDKDAYVPFPQKLGRSLKDLPIRLTPRALQIAIKKAAERANIGKDITFHTLRHSSATYYLEHGMNIREVQRLLRHSRLDTTAIYTHVSPEGIKKSMDEIWK